MKLCIALFVIVCMPLMALAGRACYTKGDKLKTFKSQSVKVSMPCKYHAVHKQRCGDYLVSLTPGHVFLYPDYEVNSLYVEITEFNKTNPKSWKGRTDNRQAVKYYEGWKTELFVKLGGDLETKDVMNSSKEGKETKASSPIYDIVFRPWNPHNPKMTKSEWEFRCNLDRAFDMKPVGFSQQTCGGLRQDLNKIAGKLKLKTKEQVVFYSIFNNTGIAHTNENCSAVTDIMTKNCSEDRKSDAMRTCTQILASKPHRMCVTKYSCDPMDVFVSCVKWICSGEADNAACQSVGESIDLCRNFGEGNLTGRVRAKGCYKEFHAITGEYPKEPKEKEEKKEKGEKKEHTNEP